MGSTSIRPVSTHNRGSHSIGAKRPYDLVMPQNWVLSRFDDVTIGVSECGSVSPGTYDEEVENVFTLVYPLSGVFGYESEGQRALASSCKMLFYSRGRAHRIDHPRGGHDRSAFITFGPDLVAGFLTDSGELPLISARTSPRVDLALRHVLAASRTSSVSRLEIEELVHDSVSSALTNVGVPPPTDGHRALVGDAEEYLAVHHRDDCHLAYIAHEVGTSPAHLSRVFRRVTGETLAQRRKRLRLVSALARISDGAVDLSTVAIEVGFYDHAHMTNAFREAWGITPGRARDLSSPMVG